MFILVRKLVAVLKRLLMVIRFDSYKRLQMTKKNNEI